MSSSPPLYSLFFLSGGVAMLVPVCPSQRAHFCSGFCPSTWQATGFRESSLDDQGAARTPDTGTGSGPATTQGEVFWGP